MIQKYVMTLKEMISPLEREGIVKIYCVEEE
jgi:hypothetical protein